jgi:hypothetical protein
MASSTIVSSAFKTEPRSSEYLEEREERHFQRLFEAQAARSYLYLSLGIGLVAIALPLLLMGLGGYEIHDSMSSYYTIDVGSSRDILVGSLCAVGVFLFLFHGLSSLENWLLNIAGFAIILVALIPMPTSELLHRGAAIVFFVLIGIVAIFLAKGRVDKLPPRKRLIFKTIYNVVGTAMVVAPLLATALEFALGAGTHWVFWAELTGILSFSAYWFAKTAEYRLLLRIRWLPPHREAPLIPQ